MQLKMKDGTKGPGRETRGDLRELRVLEVFEQRYVPKIIDEHVWAPRLSDRRRIALTIVKIKKETGLK